MTRPLPALVRLRSALFCTLALGPPAGCADAPFDPHAYQQPADGRIWTALSIPASVPTLRTWLPYVSPSERATLDEVGTLRDEAQALRKAGALERAWEREESAALLAASSLSRMPPREVLDRSVLALELWCREAEGDPRLQGELQVAESAAFVRGALARSRMALQQGDTAAAVVELARASERARSHSPEAVAVKAIAQVESRLRKVDSEESRRVLHLLASAREALGAGNSARAYWRAVYALQLAESIATP
jgi:hypothetical protein